MLIVLFQIHCQNLNGNFKCRNLIGEVLPRKFYSSIVENICCRSFTGEEVLEKIFCGSFIGGHLLQKLWWRKYHALIEMFLQKFVENNPNETLFQ